MVKKKLAVIKQTSVCCCRRRFLHSFFDWFLDCKGEVDIQNGQQIKLNQLSLSALIMLPAPDTTVEELLVSPDTSKGKLIVPIRN